MVLFTEPEPEIFVHVQALGIWGRSPTDATYSPTHVLWGLGPPEAWTPRKSRRAFGRRQDEGPTQRRMSKPDPRQRGPSVAAR